MEWLAKWMGWEVKDCYELDDAGAWDFWMTEVEPRIREKELWQEYCDALWKIVWGEGYGLVGDVFAQVMAATLAQRAEALRRVLE